MRSKVLIISTLALTAACLPCASAAPLTVTDCRGALRAAAEISSGEEATLLLRLKARDASITTTSLVERQTSRRLDATVTNDQTKLRLYSGNWTWCDETNFELAEVEILRTKPSNTYLVPAAAGGAIIGTVAMLRGDSDNTEGPVAAPVSIVEARPEAAVPASSSGRSGPPSGASDAAPGVAPDCSNSTYALLSPCREEETPPPLSPYE